MEPINITYFIERIDQEETFLNVQLKLSEAVNTTYLQKGDSFTEIFKTYWYPTTGV